MPVITIALNRQLMSWERVINRIWWNRVLRYWRQSGGHQSVVQRNLNAANAFLCLLRESGSATLGASPKTIDQRGFYVADFAANLALHLYFVFMQGMGFAYLRSRRVPVSAFAGAAIGFIVWKCRKVFAAFRAFLFDSWQAARRASIGLVGAGARAILATIVRTLMFKLFAATGTYVDRVSFPGTCAVTVSGALHATILLGLTWPDRKRLLACQADTHFGTLLAFISALCRTILLTLESRLVFDTTGRTYVHIAIVPQMRYCCNYER